jgi:N6-adenosine-specific RNA methylase IME4
VTYRAIVADPPWHYPEGFAQGIGHARGPGYWRRVDMPYPAMSLDEIRALPVAELAHPDGAWLFLWTTNRFLPDTFSVLDAWGFSYRQTIVWRKLAASPFGGCVAPNQAEYLLVAKRGNPTRKARWSESVVTTGIKAHSQKPEVFLDLVETVADGPYLEMFARRNRLGWDTWGNESLPHVEVARA